MCDSFPSIERESFFREKRNESHKSLGGGFCLGISMGRFATRGALKSSLKAADVAFSTHLGPDCYSPRCPKP